MKIVKTKDFLKRNEKMYEVIVADSNIFVICENEYDPKEDARITHYANPEVYANQSEINKLEELGFEKFEYPENGKPKFDADDAEDYFSMMYQYNRDEKERIFKRDNENRDTCNPVYSAEYQKWLGMEIALKNVLEYFSKFNLE